jgi:hypothetical protein
MRARHVVGLGLLAGAALLAPAGASAQCTGSRVVPVVGTPLLVSFPQATMAHYDGGWVVYSSPLDLTVTPVNQGQVWELCVQAASPLLGILGKPVGHLEIRVAGGPWQPLSSTRSVILSDRRTQTLPVELRLQLAWDVDGPGQYSALLTFASTQP